MHEDRFPRTPMSLTARVAHPTPRRHRRPHTHQAVRHRVLPAPPRLTHLEDPLEERTRQRQRGQRRAKLTARGPPQIGHLVPLTTRQRRRSRRIRSLSRDRKSTRLNSSHVKISYAVFCLKKKTLGATKG